MAASSSAALSVCALLGFVVCSGSRAQEEIGATAGPSFEVVSVKPSGKATTVLQPGVPAVSHIHGLQFSGRRLTCDLPLIAIIEEAFSVTKLQIVGPSWLSSDTYEIAALMPGGTTQDGARLMLRRMLIDRFGFNYHREPRDLPVYALVVGKHGFKLHEADANPPKGGYVMDTPVGPQRGSRWVSSRHFMAMATPLRSLADWLSSKMDRPVVDQSGITGVYDFNLQWELDQADRASAVPILQVLEREVGLKLEKRMQRYEILVVDGVARSPTGN